MHVDYKESKAQNSVVNMLAVTETPRFLSGQFTLLFRFLPKYKLSDCGSSLLAVHFRLLHNKFTVPFTLSAELPQHHSTVPQLALEVVGMSC